MLEEIHVYSDVNTYIHIMRYHEVFHKYVYVFKNIYLFTQTAEFQRWGKKERERRERYINIYWISTQMATMAESQVESRSLGLHPCLPHGLLEPW